MIRKTLIALLTFASGITALGTWLTVNRTVRWDFENIFVRIGGGSAVLLWTNDSELINAIDTGKYLFSMSFLPSFGSRVTPLTMSFEVFTPLAIPFIIFATYPTITFIRGPLRRYRRRNRGLCLMCGYNLTGNTSGRCPECGAEA